MWDIAAKGGVKMPVTEKEPGETVSYAFPVKKLKIDDSLEIAYVDEGDKDADILVFIHGLGTGVPVWEKNISELRHTFRCIALDLPGHGYSSKGDFPYTMHFYADVLFAFMQQLSLPAVTLVGHSMGGHIAILAGLRNLQLIERIVLISPAGIEPYNAFEKQTIINTMATVVATGNAFAENKFNYLLGFCEDQQQAGELAAKMAFFKDDAANFGRMKLRSVEAMMLESVNHTLDKLSQPTLILVGKEDKVSPFVFFRGMKYSDILALEATKVPHCKLVLVPDCGHFVQFQKPKVFNKELMAFLPAKQTV
jgi:pimeloyl-ACP methyl ester carboxylesterase